MANNGFADFMPDIDFTSYMLQSDPKAAYFSSAPFQGASSPAQRQYWQGQFGNVFNQFQGAFGSALRNKEETPTFMSFLRDNPFTERYTALSPSMRPGSGTKRFNPGTRYMYS